MRSVIPEGAKRLSGIQKKTIVYWIPDLDFVSSGMTFGAVSRLFQHPASEQLSKVGMPILGLLQNATGKLSVIRVFSGHSFAGLPFQVIRDYSLV
jgi:hypothetical protein